MSLKLDKLNEIPPGGYVYRDPSTGAVVTGPTYPDWVQKVKAHKRANSLPITQYLEEEMQDQLCQTLPAGWCVRDGSPYDGNIPRLSFDQVLNGTAALVDWYISGKKKVDRDTAQLRANICSTCPFNKVPEGCSSCNQGKILNLANRIVGGEQLDGSDKIQSCVKCGCSLKAKVWLEDELLQRHINGVEFPKWCWMNKK